MPRSDDEVIVIDDDAPIRARRPRKARKPAEPILLDSDYEPEQQEKPGKKRSRKTTGGGGGAAAAAAYACDSDEHETAAPQKQRKKKKVEEKEKRTDAQGRTVRYSSAPSQAVYTRIQRALPGSAHRMFLISTQQLAPEGAAGGRAQEFAVLGATGNVYNVTISRHPHCTCPDHAKGNLCKHILFVMLRCLKLATDNPLVWQKALLTQEVEDVLSGAHSQGSDLAGVLADERVRQAYSAAAAGGSPAAAGGAAAAGGGDGDGRRKEIEGDCPICFDELKAQGEPLVWCQGGCGNNMHKKCFDVWASTKRRAGAAITCVYCRAPWVGEAPAGAAGEEAAEPSRYMNLSQHSAAHAGADTSMEALYGDNAFWIQHHRAGGAGRGGAARMWSGGFGGGRRFYRR